MTSSESGPDAERGAGIITRGMAAVIDLVVVLLIMSALYGGLILVRLVYSPAAFSLPSLNAVFSTLVTFVVAVLYLTGCWTVSGSTAGAVAMGLRVVGRRSQRVRLPVGLLRAIGCVLFPVGLLWVVIDRQRDRCRTSSSARGWSTHGQRPGDVAPPPTVDGRSLAFDRQKTRCRGYVGMANVTAARTQNLAMLEVQQGAV